MGFEKFLLFKKPKTEERIPEIKTPKDILRLPTSERPEALKEFKEKLVKKKEWFAGIQEEIMRYISLHPDAKKEELYTLAVSAARKESIDLTEEQRRVIKFVLHECEKRTRYIDEVTKKFPNEADLFKFLLKRKPRGEVEAWKGLGILMFRCFDFNDFVWAHRGIAGRPPLMRHISDKDMSASSFNGAVTNIYSPRQEFQGILAVENAGACSIDQSMSVFIHEQQHNLYRLFQKALKEEHIEAKLQKIKSQEDVRDVLRRYFRAIRRQKETMTKNELLAYLKNEKYTPQQIIYFLLKTAEENGLYDYFKEDKKNLSKRFVKKLGSKYESLVLETIAEVFEKEYEKLIGQAIDAFFILRDRGYSTEKAIALLMTEPLWKWKKTVERVK